MLADNFAIRRGMPRAHRDRYQYNWLEWKVVHNKKLGELADFMEDATATVIIAGTAICTIAGISAFVAIVLYLLERLVWAI